MMADIIPQMENRITVWAGHAGLSRRVRGSVLVIATDVAIKEGYLLIWPRLDLPAGEFDALIRRVAHWHGAGIVIPAAKIPLACRATADALAVSVLVGPASNYSETVEKIMSLVLNETAFLQQRSLHLISVIEKNLVRDIQLDDWIAWAQVAATPCRWVPAIPELVYGEAPGSVVLEGLQIGAWQDAEGYWDSGVIRVLALATTLVAERNVASWADEWNWNRSFLMDLLDGIDGRGRGMSAVQRLAWNFELPTVVLMLSLDEKPTDSLTRWKAVRRQLESIEALLRRQGYVPRLFPYGEYLAVLVQGAPGTLIPSHLTGLGRQLVSLGNLEVGIGRAHVGLAGIRQSLNEAEEALVIGRGEKQGVSYFSQLGIRRYLFGWYNSPRSTQLADELLAPLEEGRPANDSLTETLGVFLQNGARLTTTAQALQIHRNTLRYRLDRLGEILGVDLNDPDTLLILQLAWRTRERKVRQQQFAQKIPGIIQQNAEDK